MTARAVPTTYNFRSTGTAPQFNSAFARGCGGPLVQGGEVRPGPLALWGEHTWYGELQKLIGEGRTWYYGDHAYFGRHIYYRITRNALQHSGIGEPNLQRLDDVRRNLRHVAGTLDFRADRHNPEGLVIVCPPSVALASRSGFAQADWIKRVTAKLRRVGNPYIVRHKPRVNRAPAPLLTLLEERDAWGVITYTGNTAIEALVAGYAAITTGPNPARAFPMPRVRGLRSAVVPSIEARMNWASVLCSNQWTLAEIAAGRAWRELNV